MRQRSILSALCLLGFLFWRGFPAAALAQERPSRTLFGPATFTRITGPPTTEARTFSVPSFIIPPFQLHLENGIPDGTQRMSSGRVLLNGVEIIGPNDFNQQVATIDRQVSLQATNTLQLRLASGPGGKVTITIFGLLGDLTPPTLNITPANGSTLNTKTPLPRIAYADPIGGTDPVSSGVDRETLLVQINGTDRTSLFTKGETEATAQLTSESALNEGANTIQASIKDRAGNVASAIANITVVTAPVIPAGFGLVLGQVIDAVTHQPLAAATIKALGTTSQVQSDSVGRFQLPAPAGNRVPVHVNKGGHVDAKIFASVEAGRESSVGTVRLHPFDQAKTLIGSAGGAHTDATGTVQVLVPTGAINTTLEVSATVFPTAETFPVKLPEGQAYLAGVQFTPENLTFARPVTVRFPNRLNLPPNTPVPFAFADHSEQNPDVTFFDPGTARVSADGQFIEAEITHFSCPVFAPPVLPPAASTVPSPESRLPQTCDPSSRACVPGGSQVGIQEGSLTLDLRLPSVRALGRSQGPTFVYTSATANPAPVIATATNLTTTPQTTGWRLQIEGTEVTTTFQGGTGLQRQAFLWDAKDGRGNVLPTGSYSAKIEVSSAFAGNLATTDGFGGPPLQDLGIPAPTPAVLSMPSGGRVLVHNQRQSPFGAGWGLQGLWQLHLQPDGSALLTEGSGTALHFAPMGEVETPFPQGGPSRFALAADEQGTIYAGVFGAVSSVLRIDPTTGAQSTIFTVQGRGFVQALTAARGRLYVGIRESVLGQHRIATVDLGTGAVLSERPITTEPRSLAVDPTGRLYVYDGSSIFRLLPNGPFTLLARIPVLHSGSFGLVLDEAGNLYVPGSDPLIGASAPLIYRVTPSGQFGVFATLPPTRPGTVFTPNDLTRDSNGNLYAVSEGEDHLLRITPQGTLTVYAKGLTNAPRRVAAGPSGELWVLNAFLGTPLLHRVRSLGTAFAPPLGDFSTLTRDQRGTPNDPTDDLFLRRLKDGTRFVFNAQGFHIQTVDRNGNTVSYAYDPQGHLVSMTDPAGQVTSLSYAGDKLSSATDPAGRTTRFSMDGTGNLVQVTLPDGATTSFSYNGGHLLTAKTDPRGFVTEYLYDTFSRLTQIRHPTGEVRQYQPSATQGVINALPTGSGTPDNPAPVPPFPLDRVTDGRGRETIYQTNRFGSLDSITDPLGRTSTFRRDLNNNVLAFARPDLTGVSLSYDQQGNVLVFSRTAHGTKRSFFTYEPIFNQVTSITDFNGNTTRISYDAQGNPTQITDALTNRTTLAYDSRGLLTSVMDALNHITSFTYDAKGNLVSTADPLGNTTSLEYDMAGNVLRSTDAFGRATAFTYDPMNRLIQVNDAAGGITRYTYDATGNLTTVTDANGQATIFEHDGVNQLSRTANPLGQIKTFAYDLARNLASTTDAKGQVIAFEYDAANQLLHKILPTGEAVTFAYDVHGNLTLAQDADSKLAFTYDGFDQLTRVVTGGAGLPQPQTTIQIGTPTTLGYDLNGNRLRMVDPLGGVTDYTYDRLNRLTSLTNPQGQRFTFAYDALSRRTSMALPNGVVTTYAYDAASQLTSLLHHLSGSPVASFAYSYDRVGNRTAMTELAGANTYAYDQLNRLIQAAHPQPTNPTEGFAYDAVGNRIASHLATGQVHDAANRLLEDSNFTYTYDANGNLVQKVQKATGEVTTYTYDAENQLMQVTKPGLVVTYRYDALGRRIEKVVNGVITRYIYDNEDVLMDLDGANQVVARYTHGPGIDEPLAVARFGVGGGTFVFHADGLGSTSALTDLTGTPVRSYIYDSFGRLVTQTGTVANPYTYTAREFDPETGLYYYRARYYDTISGRFLQEDLFGGLPRFPQSLNRFAYVANNPINFIDPEGLFLQQTAFAFVGGAAIGFFAGGVTAAWIGEPPQEVLRAAISGGISGGVAAGLASIGVPFPMSGALGNLTSQSFAEVRAGTIGTPGGFLRVGFSTAIGVGVGGLAGQVLPQGGTVGRLGLAGLNAMARTLSNQLFSAIDVALDFFRGRTDKINRLIERVDRGVGCP